MAKIAIIVYSTYGHLFNLAKEIQKGIESANGSADLFRVPETLSDEVLAKMHAPKADESFEVATLDTLKDYDAFLFGIPTRFGNMPAQWSEFWGTTGGLWASGALYGKKCGLFVATGTPGGGQEVTARNFMSTIAHHGLIYVPLGYGAAFQQITSFEEIHGGSPWGAGMYAGADGSRQASETEKEIARIQGSEFVKVLSSFGGEKSVKEESTASSSDEKTETKPEATKARESQSVKEPKDTKSIGCSISCVIM